MTLISIRSLSIGYRGPLLLDEVDCQIEPGQRIGLLGRNGSGKTTFMKILSGEVEADSGDVTISEGTKIALLPQDVPQDIHGSIQQVVAAGVDTATHEDDSDWKAQHQVDQILSRMELQPEGQFETLSSGMKRRVLLARAIVNEPDLLLLDEPTNHLDIEAICWLEEFLLRYRATFMFVTHDRMFLRKLASRILEVDRGRLFDWSCDYDTFLERKEAALAAEEKQNALFDKKLAIEEVWIRQGIEARRTRNEGRVRALKKMREQRRDRRSNAGTVNLQIQEGQRSGNMVTEVKGISFAYENLPIVDNFSTKIMRGDKVGIIGPNGAGKTTLLRIILGQLEPQQGSIRLGTNLQIAYFDQLRGQLDEEQTVQENVGDGYESIQIGNAKKHVIGYLQDFLFSPERARTQVKFLSGGERNRVLLAKLFAKPANVIVLDEPTNDLDSETLELLEERLVNFEGTILLVSHDRAFLNNVVTSSIVFEPEGVKEYFGGYDDWVHQRGQQEIKKNSSEKKETKNTKKESKPSQPTQTKKLSYNEKRELEALPATIEKLETEISKIHETMAEAEFYQQAGEKIASVQANLKELESQLEVAFTRWEELEG